MDLFDREDSLKDALRAFNSMSEPVQEVDAQEDFGFCG